MVVFTVSRSPMVSSAVAYSAMLSLWNSMLSGTPGELWLTLAQRPSCWDTKPSSESLCWLAIASRSMRSAAAPSSMSLVGVLRPRVEGAVRA